MKNHKATLAAIALTFCTQTVLATDEDFTVLTLEQLLEVSVTSATKFRQRSADAPSAVQIIEREEIKRHGWRTLSEALGTLPGIYVNNDRSYDFLGGRGFQIPGDYNTRFLLLVDGQRNNDNLFQSVMTDSAGWLDMSAIERIEYIPGPGSAIYGSNAMLVVINIITRSGRGAPATQIGTHISQRGDIGVNMLSSKTLSGEGDTHLFIQFSAENQAAHDTQYTDPLGQLVMADNTVSANGIAAGMDNSQNRRMRARIDSGEWSLGLSYHQRVIHPSSAPYFALFNDPSITLIDGGTQLNLSVDHPLSNTSSITARIGYTNWYYKGTYPYLDPALGYYQNHDDYRGQMLDGEVHYQTQLGDHHLLGGMDFDHDLLARQGNYNSVAIPGAPYVNINTMTSHTGLFIQDDWRINQNWLINGGMRIDHASRQVTTTSPRVALIWQPVAAWTAKLLLGKAYRSANAYESLFSDNINYLANPGLKTESVNSAEMVIEWLKDQHTRWQFSLYENQIDNLIQQIDTGGGVLQFQNLGKTKVRGLELGIEKNTASELKLRGSLALNQSPNHQDNSPGYIAKASASAPILGETVYIASELQLTGSRHYLWNATQHSVPTEVMLNATLTMPNLWIKGMQAQFRISNLLDGEINQPASAEMLMPLIPQNRRNVMLTLSYDF